MSKKVTTAEGGPTETPVDAKLERSLRRFKAAQRRLAARVGRQMSKREQSVEALAFRVATFNVLGDSHTGPGGNKPGFPDGGPRMDMAISALRNNGIDVVGFQEFEASQHAMFTARAGEYSLYPGLSLGDKSVRFNIAWRSSMFRLVEGRSLSIPYAGGSRIAMPVVLLESTTTGRRAWFANFHNPADTPNLGNNARWRAEAAGIEVSYLSALHQEQGLPVIATGDYNEREEIFCRFTAGGIFSAAAGGSRRRWMRTASADAGRLDLRIHRSRLRGLCRDQHRQRLRPRHGPLRRHAGRGRVRGRPLDILRAVRSLTQLRRSGALDVRRIDTEGILVGGQQGAAGRRLLRRSADLVVLAPARR